MTPSKCSTYLQIKTIKDLLTLTENTDTFEISTYQQIFIFPTRP